jgi:pimeloyl-ACP methyl ester carboxylesterase
LAFYRTRDADVSDVLPYEEHPLEIPVLATGGRYAMGIAVAEGMRTLALDVTGLVFEHSGHYPTEQEPEDVNRAVVNFLRRNP